MEASAATRIELDVRGFKCPVPTLKMTNLVMGGTVQKGDTLVVIADCDTFEADVRKWCETMKRVLIVLKPHGVNAQCAEVRI